ncbi:HAMP domain-containing sensor histidine kinase [Arthrobacter sp. H35-D1]|uniref:sensor histidine kinase n=1 Tax=Arthrobacter sp. H35-D1 TaxID=3046202 RepID=UPI0024BA8D76|nr:HAMP domain-containing sensor histidine kinase [Arthrobacter sp. H35-D1]MDJ0314177.1 HAMP domain-containing sensor histidine kinase [Arthrobacter sp. H35-D1]
MNTRDVAELRRSVVRLALQFTVLIVVLLAVMGGLLYSIVAASTAEALNKTLMGATQIDSPRDAPAGVYVAIADEDQVKVSPVMPAGLPDQAAMNRVDASQSDEQQSLEVGGHTYEVLTTIRNDKVVQAAVDTHEGSESLNRLAWSMVVAGTAAALLAAAVSVWMAVRAMRPLAESLALQRRFVADASHELRTPLTLLSTRSQLLRRKLEVPGTDFSREAVSTEVSAIVEDSRLLTGILDDLLISVDPRSAVAHTAVDLAEVSRNAVALAMPQAVQRSIQLAQPAMAVPILVQGSPVALLRVFTALIANAMDHAQSEVSVAVSSKGTDVCIEVSDDGPGFMPGTESRVFERFSSLRPASVGAGPPRHYGLGLALVAEIVALHNGKITVGSAPSGGAAIRIILPLAAK